MNKHAIVILYSGADRDPGCDVIESIANVIAQAGLTVPELIEIKHFDSNSISEAVISKSAVKCKKQSAESELIKQSIIYFVETYKHLTDPRKSAQILADALHGYNNPTTENQIAFKNAMDTIVSNQQKASRMGMSKRFIEMITYAYDVIKSM